MVRAGVAGQGGCFLKTVKRVVACGENRGKSTLFFCCYFGLKGLQSGDFCITFAVEKLFLA